jgi:hypothetical protein
MEFPRRSNRLLEKVKKNRVTRFQTVKNTWRSIKSKSKTKSKTKSPHYTLKSRSPLQKSRKITSSVKGNLASKLILRNQSKRISKFLKMICSDSCGCLVFGREVEKINFIFDNFKNFNFASSNAQRVGAVSANGFVFQIEYKNDEYNSNALLKSSINKTSDNLYYEYLVGIHFLNNVNTIFPCFTQTYHILRNNSDELKLAMQKNKLIPIKDIEQNFSFYNKNDPIDTSESCVNADKLSILVQYIRNPINFSKFLVDAFNSDFYLNDLTQIMYQVYGPLSILSKVYTHYDLHQENVLLYKLQDKTYITMNYVYKHKTVSFNTNFVSKIIDYGRSYFYTDKTINSRKILEQICAEKACMQGSEKCGISMGFGWMELPISKEEYKASHYICSSIPNKSHDLRLATFVKDKICYKSPYSESPLALILEKLNYEGEYGTGPANSTNFNSIHNVNDLALDLSILIKKNDFGELNKKKHADDACIGILNIYMDDAKRDMFFTSS